MSALERQGVKVDMGLQAGEDGVVIELREGKACQYAVVQLESIEEREKAINIHHDESITEKFTVATGVQCDGENRFGVLTREIVQLDIKPYRQRGEKCKASDNTVEDKKRI